MQTSVARPHDLLGQTVVIIGGSSGIGLAAARSAKAAGARLIITDRHAGRLEEAADELGVEATAAFDELDLDQLDTFLAQLPMLVDHLVVCVSAPRHATLGWLEYVQAEEAHEDLLAPLVIARFAAAQMPAGASLVFVKKTGTLPLGVGLTVPVFATAGLPAMITSFALEVAPVRVNLIVTAPASRITPDGVGALAVHLMTNTALTGGTYDLASSGL
jgi:NAD(P)-dependent dehydrogenase (short-subunit alcohol dehydrogenase family)